MTPQLSISLKTGVCINHSPSWMIEHDAVLSYKKKSCEEIRRNSDVSILAFKDMDCSGPPVQYVQQFTRNCMDRKQLHCSGGPPTLAKAWSTVRRSFSDDMCTDAPVVIAARPDCVTLGKDV